MKKPKTDLSHIAEAIRHLAVPIESLHPDPANARAHGEQNIAAITASLRRFGQRLPLVVQRDGMIVRAGNGRLAAARAMGWTHIAAVIVDEGNADASAFALADNRTSELAEWDDARLAELLKGLPTEIRCDIGFSDADMKELLASLQSGEVVEDEAPEPLPAPVSVRGDLWLMGEHRLLCGDSTDAADVALVMNGERASGTVTDPPYGVGFNYESWDDESKTVNDELFASVFALCPRPLCYTFGRGNIRRELNRWPDTDRLDLLAWNKKFCMTRSGLGGFHTWEPVLVVGAVPSQSTLPKTHIEFMTDREPGLIDGHPCPKPVALWSHLMQHLFPGNAYEPFSGSGTALIAAEQLARRCLAIEIEPRYVDVAVRRWQKLTGNQATHAKTGHTWAQTASERGVPVPP